MAFIQDALKVATIAALKALTSSTEPKRVDGAFYAVDNNGDGVPSWYLYSAASAATEDLPKIVSPTDTTGRFIQFAAGGNQSIILTVSDTSPIASPPSVTPITGGQVCLHLEMNFTGSSSVFQTWIGIDSTGTEGNNGWYYNSGWYF